jgi:hypothetical protein
MSAKASLNSAERARLLPVLKRFPEERLALLRLFRQNSSFQSLCEDYRDCLAALQYWEQAASGEAPTLANTYTELLGELEQEVGQFLKAERVSKPD